MANVTIFKCVPYIFCGSFYRLWDIQILIFLHPKSMSRSQSIIFEITILDARCQNLQISQTHFCASSYCFRYIIFVILLRPKRWSRNATFSKFMNVFWSAYEHLALPAYLPALVQHPPSSCSCFSLNNWKQNSWSDDQRQAFYTHQRQREFNFRKFSLIRPMIQAVTSTSVGQS